MTVNKYATQAGKKYETDLMKYLRSHAFDVERLRLTGEEDEGDLLIRYDDDRGNSRRVVVEAKRRKSMDLAGWVKEAQVERDHYIAHRHLIDCGFVVVHYARNKGIGGSYVTTTLDEWMKRL